MKSTLFWLCLALSIGCSIDAPAIEKGTEKSAQTHDLQAGDYVWHPETASTGPVVIIVDLSKQLLQVYRAGVLIGRSTISSGKGSHATPTGLFTILQKRTSHHSNAYHEASMPYMERLTWGGLAIHAGNNPGYPESHGCVHVPLDFAKKLYTLTEPGTTVLVTDGSTAPTPPKKVDLVFSRKGNAPSTTTVGGAPFSWKPKASPTGPVCMIYSSADKQILVYRKGVEIGNATVSSEDADQPAGDRVYAALAQTNAAGLHDWQLLGSLDSSPAPDAGGLLSRVSIPPAFLADMRQSVTPGTTLVITDEPVHHESPQDQDTTILDTAGP